MTAVTLAPEAPVGCVRHTITATCPRCGDPLTSTPQPDPSTAVRRATVTCPLHGSWVLTVTLTPTRSPR